MPGGCWTEEEVPAPSAVGGNATQGTPWRHPDHDDRLCRLTMRASLKRSIGLILALLIP